MLESVGEGLLHEPVHRELNPGRHVRRFPVDLQRGVQARGPDLLDERVEPGEIGYGRKSLAGILAGALTQDAEEPARIG